MLSPFTQADIRKIHAEAAPVPMHQFRTANQSLMRLIQAARAALDERVNQKIAELTRLFDAQAARLEAQVSSIHANRDADAQKIAKTVVQEVLKQIRQPKDGDTPLIDYSRIVREVLPYIRVPEDGASPDPEMLLTQLEQRLPALGLAIHDALKLLPEEDRPSITLFGDLEDYLKPLIKTHSNYSSGNAVIPVMVSGAIKSHAASALNFKGAGAPTVTVGANGVTDIVFAASGGGITVEIPPEAPDASRTQFTVSAQPKWMVADGTTYYQGAGYAYSTDSVTFDVPPSEFVRAII